MKALIVGLMMVVGVAHADDFFTEKNCNEVYGIDDSPVVKSNLEWCLRKSKVQHLSPYVKIGMTAKQVTTKTSWGEPNSINRTITSAGTNEQWIYGHGNYLYFRNGVLYAIQN